MNLYKKITKIMVFMIAFSVVALNAPITSAAPESDPLEGSCSVNEDQILQEGSVTWSVSATDGSGSYTYAWSGDDGLSGSSTNVDKTYNNPGVFNAEVTISDGTEEITVECDDSVHVVAFLEFQSCEADEIAYTIGYGPTHWFANLTGGIGPYTVDWSSDDGLTGSGIKSDDITYTTDGEKNAEITGIESADGQEITFDTPKVCSPNMMVHKEAEPSEEELTISCSASKSIVKTEEEITWTVEINGGESPYTINWNGSEELSGSDEQVSITYSTEGTKTASVMISDSSASSTMRNTSCGNIVVDDSNEEETSSGPGSSSSRSGGSSFNTSSESSTDDNDDEDDDEDDDSEDDLDEIVTLLQTLATIENQASVGGTADTVTPAGTNNASSDESETTGDTDETPEEETQEDEESDSDDDDDFNQLAAVGASSVFDDFPIFWSILIALIVIGLVGFLVWRKRRNK